MAKPRPLPPLETLREALDYDAKTGLLTWKVNRLNGILDGALSGCSDGHGYIQVKLWGRRFKAHRLAWALHYGTDPGSLQVDHVNRNRSDNRISNLRLVDAKGNRANSLDNSRPVRVIYVDGNSRILRSATAAARLLGCSPRSVHRYAQGSRSAPNGLQVNYAPTT